MPTPALSIRLKSDLRSVMEKFAERDNRSLGNAVDTYLRKVPEVKEALEKDAKREARR